MTLDELIEKRFSKYPTSDLSCLCCGFNGANAELLLRQFASEIVKELLPEEKHLMGVLGDNDYMLDAGYNNCVREIKQRAKEIGIEI